MRITRATIAGIVGGLVLLALFAGFAVGLPKVTGGLPDLPDRLDNGYVAISAATADELGVTSATDAQSLSALVANAKKQDQHAADELSELYGDATVRTYLDVSAIPAARQGGPTPGQLAVTVVKAAPGLVIPSGPVQVDMQGQHYQLKKIDGFDCAVTYADAQPASQTSAAQPTTYLQTDCRAPKGELTYDVFGSNIAPDDVVALLKSLTA
jgi:hypothetical protein